VVNRYTHSPVEVLDGRDLEEAVDLLRGYLSALPGRDLGFLPRDAAGE
jgi:endoglucanase